MSEKAAVVKLKLDDAEFRAQAAASIEWLKGELANVTSGQGLPGQSGQGVPGPASGFGTVAAAGLGAFAAARFGAGGFADGFGGIQGSIDAFSMIHGGPGRFHDPWSSSDFSSPGANFWGFNPGSGDGDADVGPGPSRRTGAQRASDARTAADFGGIFVRGRKTEKGIDLHDVGESDTQQSYRASQRQDWLQDFTNRQSGGERGTAIFGMPDWGSMWSAANAPLPGSGAINRIGSKLGMSEGLSAVAGKAAGAAGPAAAVAIGVAGLAHQADYRLNAEMTGRQNDTYDAVLGWVGMIPGLGGIAETSRKSYDWANDVQQKQALASIAAITGDDVSGLASSAAGIGIPHMQAASRLGSRLTRGLGRNASGVALSLVQDLFNADPTKDKTLSPEQADALAAASSAEVQQAFGRSGYDRGVAANLAVKDPAAAAAYIQLKGGKDNAADLSFLAGNVETQGFRVQSAMSNVAAAGSHTQSVTARGGTASAIGTSIGGEIGALQEASAATQKYIEYLKSLGDTMADGGAKIAGARAAMAAIGASADELRYQRTSLASAEAQDRAGTATAISSSAMPSKLAGAKRGDFSLFDGMLKDQIAERDTTVAELNRPGLKPEDYRRLKRQKAQQDAAIFQTRKMAADYEGGQDSQFADLAAQGAQAFLSGVEITGTSADISATRKRYSSRVDDKVTMAQGKLVWMQQHPSDYTDADREQQENVILSAKNDRTLAHIEASRSPLSRMEDARLERQDILAQRASRQGGTAALGATRGMISSWSDIRSKRQAAYDANPNYATLGDLNNADRTLQRLGESLGAGGLDATIGTEIDRAASRMHVLNSDQFEPGDRLAAGINLFNSVGKARGDAQKRLTGATDPQVRRQLQSEINSYDEQQAELDRNLNDGWYTRLASHESNAPSRSAMIATTNRDYLMFHKGNRFTGGDGEPYSDRYTAGAGRTDKPGNANNQAIKVVVELTGSGVDALKQAGIGARVTVKNDPKAALNARRAG
ncbi:MAG TPA: hypothetical protein VGM51_09550 [Armatimonadota bacterium]|jgi:hypothetical protein